jgi:DNA-binding CsgD family transcriptional regulator
MQVGRYDDAVPVAQEGMEYGRTHVADLGPLVMIEANVIEAHIYAGRLREAEELGGLLPLVEPGLYSAFLRERLVCLAIWRGRIDGAEAALEAARLELDRFGAYEYQTRFGMAYDLGELALARGDAHEALLHARLAWETPAGGVLALPLTGIAARAVAMLRERGEDADIEPYRAVLAGFDAWPVTPLWAAVFAAELGEGPWTVAIDAVGPAYVRAYARVRHGESLLADGDRTGAREALAAAASYAEGLGADGLAARARAVMTDAGLTGDASRSVLTAREEQVLELVAEGLSNGQIAERLYISVKTVSVHVSAILRKLEAPSRTAAAAIYRRSAA